MARYRKCHLWRGGHRWSRWQVAPYHKYSGGVKITVTYNERTCEKCGKVETEGM